MLGATLDAGEYFARMQSELERVDRAAMERWADLMYVAWDAGNCVYAIGNGGSGTTATHISQDFGKSSLRESDLSDESKKRLKVLSLTDNAGWIMAIGNDLAYDQIFVQQLMNFGQPGDVLLAISGSGNSANVLNAVDWANRHGMNTFGLTGYDGGRLKEMQQDGLHIAIDDMGMVESIHMIALHWVLNDLYGRINSEGRYSSG